MDEQQVFEHLRESGAMLEGHFELSSGNHSERYFQCALLLQDPRRAEELANALAFRLHDEVSAVVGPALGAVVWAHEVARALGCRGMFTERVDGVMTLRRGFTFGPGEKTLVVEDVVTTGGSIRECIEACSERGADVVGVGVVLDRSGGNPFADLELPLTSLAEIDAVVWKPEDCPLCLEGGQAVKPGSRPGGPPSDDSP